MSISVASSALHSQQAAAAVGFEPCRNLKHMPETRAGDGSNPGWSILVRGPSEDKFCFVFM